MVLELNDLSVDCVIGDLPDERTRLQRLRIDLALTLDDACATASDDLADTVDYAALADRVRAVLVAAECRMVERAAQLVLETCRADGKVRHARVKVTKSGAIPGLGSASVTLEG